MKPVSGKCPMKTCSSSLLAHLQGEVTQLCSLWLITRTDGTVMGFTDFQKDIVYGGNTYASKSGFTRTAIKTTSDLSVNNMEVESIFDSDYIAEVDLRAGKYDYAQVVVYTMCWAHPEWGVIIIQSGTLGEVTLQDQTFKTELRGLTQPYAQSVGELTTPTCRADYGDKRCTLTPPTGTGTVTAITSQWEITSDNTSQWSSGSAKFTSGANTGWTVELMSATAGTINFFLPAPYTIQIGDALLFTGGCNKTLANCTTNGNIANFRGEPWIPGNDAIYSIPDAPPPAPAPPPPSVSSGTVNQKTTSSTTSTGG